MTMALKHWQSFQQAEQVKAHDQRLLELHLIFTWSSANCDDSM